MNIYTLETEDGRIVEVEGNSPPTDADFQQIMANLPPIEEQKPKSNVKKAFEDADPFEKSMITSGSMYGSPYEVLPEDAAEKDIDTVKQIASFAIPTGIAAKIATKAIPALAKAPSALRAVGRMGGEVAPIAVLDETLEAAKGEGFDVGKVAKTTALGTGIGGIIGGGIKVGGALGKFINKKIKDSPMDIKRLATVIKNSTFGGKLEEATAMSAKFANEISKKIRAIKDQFRTDAKNWTEKYFGKAKINYAKRAEDVNKTYTALSKKHGNKIIAERDDFIKNFYSNIDEISAKEVERVIDFGIKSSKIKPKPININLGIGRTIRKQPKEYITFNSILNAKKKLDDLIDINVAKGEKTIASGLVKAREKLLKYYPEELKLADKAKSTALKKLDYYNAGLRTNKHGDDIKNVVNFPGFQKLGREEKIAVAEGLRDRFVGDQEKILGSINTKKFRDDITDELLEFEELSKYIIGTASARKYFSRLERQAQGFKRLRKVSALSDATLNRTGSELIEEGRKARGDILGLFGGLTQKFGGPTITSLGLGRVAMRMQGKRGVEDAVRKALRSREITAKLPMISKMLEYDITSPLVRVLTQQLSQENK